MSTGINPYHYPLPEIRPEWLTRLPEPGETESMLAGARIYYGAPDNAAIVAGAGMQPLIAALAADRLRRYGKGRVAILSPTYCEHARVWLATGHEIFHRSGLETLEDRVDIVILCNPNNPDGRHWQPDILRLLAKRLEQRNGWLVVDESFADLAPELSLSKEASQLTNVFTLKSTGKFFGLPGLRASFAIVPPAYCEWLEVSTGAWPVSSAACHILTRAFADGKWITEMRRRLAGEAQQWREMLKVYAPIIGYTDLFTLLNVANVAVVADHLAEQGIAVRTFAEYPDWLRIGLPTREWRDRAGEAMQVATGSTG